VLFVYIPDGIPAEHGGCNQALDSVTYQTSSPGNATGMRGCNLHFIRSHRKSGKCHICYVHVFILFYFKYGTLFILFHFADVEVTSFQPQIRYIQAGTATTIGFNVTFVNNKKDNKIKEGKNIRGKKHLRHRLRLQLHDTDL
jgi:hypothetical protein